ncbi:DUF6668 family protein [Streptomyces sp. NPDC091279]|uniref:DUF6668 family protein n=1 Tax=unclassified Streptomyces TaxID=2593676 RepID=UPI0037F951A7
MGTDRSDGGLGPEIWVRGPVDAPSELYSWVGAHGGAGTSTLAGVFGGHDSGREWPVPPAPGAVLLVARTHAAGLAAALRTLQMFRNGEPPAGLTLNAVVLVADSAGRLPRALVQQVRRLEPLITVHRVPWVPAWRLGDFTGAPPRETTPLARALGGGDGGTR